MRRGITTALLAIAVLIAVACAYLYWNPFWLVNQSMNLYLRSKGIQHEYVMVDGYRIHYLEAKPAGNGPEKPVLLVHGLGARASDWAKMMPALAADGYHVYALDLLGYGDSPKPVDGDFTLDGEERIATAFLRAMKLERVDLGGWSMGGWVAMKMSLDHPEMVRRLMVYDTAGMYFVLDFPPSLFSPHDRASFDALMDKIEPSRWRTRIPTVMIPGMVRRFQENQFIVQQSFGSMLHGRELLDFRLGGLKMPMLIVWGTEDRLIPLDVGLRMHDLVPQSVFLGVRKCGHLTAAECAPPVVDETLRFLNADPPLPRSTSYADAPE